MGGNVDIHNDLASSDEVSEKPWLSYTRSRGMTEKVCGNSGCTACTRVLQFMTP